MPEPPTITEDEANSLVGTPTCSSAEHVLLDKYECGVDELEEAALEHNVELCPNCQWWVESGELVPEGEEDPDGYCGNCRHEKS